MGETGEGGALCRALFDSGRVLHRRGPHHDVDLEAAFELWWVDRRRVFHLVRETADPTELPCTMVDAPQPPRDEAPDPVDLAFVVCATLSEHLVPPHPLHHALPDTVLVSAAIGIVAVVVVVVRDATAGGVGGGGGGGLGWQRRRRLLRRGGVGMTTG